MTDNIQFESGDALLIVDVQNDFCPGGALAVEDGDSIVPVINRWTDAASKNPAVRVYTSQDWHPVDHCSFAEQGGPWPAHCVADTAGADLHAGLKLGSRTRAIFKGTEQGRDQYSALDDDQVIRALKADHRKRLIICGLALDVCVKATALDARKAGFDVVLIDSACRAITPEGAQQTRAELRRAGVRIISGEAGPKPPAAAAGPGL